MSDELSCGLFLHPGEPGRQAKPREVPLEGVRIDARLAGLATEVTVAQRYRNRETVPVEAVYVFPLEEGAAVCGFAARIGDQIVRGRVEERERAFEIYDDAMSGGHGAFLLDQERPNVFTASVGNLRPGETVEIEITYVALARGEGDAVRFQIPTTVSPRYVSPDRAPEVGEPDAERVNPERWLAVPYGLELRVEVEAASEIRAVESPSHPLRTTIDGRAATVELSRSEVALDRDFVLRVETAEPHRPAALAGREDDGTRVCQVTFYPDLDGEEAAAGSEVLFLLDCSASMAGDSIDQARRALALSIRALEEGDSFNVVRFGSTWRSLWKKPRAFGEETLEEASRWIGGARADLGGTEIRPPLKKLLTLKGDPERRRQILLLTDGEVADEGDIVRLGSEHAASSRIFTFGIGAGASEYLVRELARVSRGAAEFVFPGERIEPKVLRMFGRVRAPALSDVGLDWGGLEVEQAPASVPPVFAGDALTVFARVRSGTANHVTLHAGGESWRLDLDLEGAAAGGPIPTLWAREAIRDLERGIEPRRGSRQQRPEAEERRRRRLLELGRRYGLISSAASYVAVAERTEEERAEGVAELRKVPVALTIGWGGYGRLLPGSGPAGRRPLKRIGPASRIPGTGLPVTVAAMQTGVHMAAAAPAVGRAAGEIGGRMSDAVGGFLKRLGARQPAAAGFSAAVDLPPGPPGSAAEPATDDRVWGLLMTQKADGSFRLSPVLEEWLGSAYAAAERAAGDDGEAVVATAVAVALLERDEASRADEWRPAVKKARKWLARQGSSFDPDTVLGERAVRVY